MVKVMEVLGWVTRGPSRALPSSYVASNMEFELKPSLQLSGNSRLLPLMTSAKFYSVFPSDSQGFRSVGNISASGYQPLGNFSKLNSWRETRVDFYFHARVTYFAGSEKLFK